MKQMIRCLLSTLLLASLLAFNPARVSACSCAGGLPFINHVIGANAIFSGKVIGQTEATASDPDGAYSTLFTINVTKIWKGTKLPTIAISTFHTTCSYFFEVGKEYLIFANEVDGQLYTNSCSRNQLLETAERDVALLDSIFTASPFWGIHSTTTVTVHGVSTYLTEADQISVRFVLEENSAIATDTADMQADLEKQRSQLSDALRSNAVLSSVLPSLWSDGKDFYLTLTREQLAYDDLATFLQQLTQLQPTVAQDSQLPIQKIEVMFALEDCTLSVVNAHRSAFWNAQARSELLATLMGGKTDVVMAVTEEATSGPPSGVDLCNALSWRQWHDLPLATDLSTALQIEVPVTLRVTFAVKPLITSEFSAQDETVPVPTTPAFTSPLPTPTL